MKRSSPISYHKNYGVKKIKNAISLYYAIMRNIKMGQNICKVINIE